MHVLILKHTVEESVDVLQSFLESRGVGVVALRLLDDAEVLKDPGGAAAIVSTDGPIGVHETLQPGG